MARAGARPDPPYARIVAEIRRRIAAGELRAGDRVPSTRQIIREWGVAMATATRVLATLRRESLVRTVPGVGTVVAGAAAGAGGVGAGAGGVGAGAGGVGAGAGAAAGAGAVGAGAGAVAGAAAVSAQRAIRRAQRPVSRRRSGESAQELTVGRIVRAAVEIADAEGLAALSLRRVAANLDAATMALYRHVAGKDELVQLMAEAAFAEAALPEPPPPGWRARLELIARAQWAIHRRHPWLVQVMSLTRPKPAPEAMAHTEWALRAVDGLGLDPATMLYVHLTTFGYVRGIAVNFELEAAAEQDSGLTDEQWLRSQGSALHSLLASGSYPMMSRLAAQPGFAFDLDAMFEFGLRRVLDGIGVLIAGDGVSPSTTTTGDGGT